MDVCLRVCRRERVICFPRPLFFTSVVFIVGLPGAIGLVPRFRTLTDEIARKMRMVYFVFFFCMCPSLIKRQPGTESRISVFLIQLSFL